VWVVLFPDHEDEIRATWQKVEPYIPVVREYRNDVAFHANKDLRRYFETRGKFHEQRKEIVAAMQEFWGLAAKLIKNQGSALPDFRNEIEPPLKKAFPGKTPEELESLKNYFIQN